MLSVNLTFYHIVTNNLAQTAALDKDGNQTVILRSRFYQANKSDGVELDVAAQPITGLPSWPATVTTMARYTKTDTTKGSFIEGKLVNNPSNTANASVFSIQQRWIKGF
jgi:iron complex outermembrane receptor protein